MPSTSHALEASDLVKTYPAGRKKPPVRALDGLTFAVPEGVVLGLLGPNGAGKSTTVKILTTLSRADSGTATVAGFDVVKQQNDVRQAIGYVPQKSSSDPMATGVENLVLSGRIYGLSRQEAVRRAAELLERFDLTEAGGRQVRTYSGGMQRKLDVALGLVHRPRVLFLDEPTTGLDPEARADLWNEVERLSDNEGLTVLLTTHYLEEADRLADQLAIVDHGQVVAEGTPEALKAELRGDSVQVELVDADVDGNVRRLLGHLPGIGEIVVDGNTLRARVDRGATAVPAVLGALEEKAIPVTAVTVSRPSLDDVYLQYTGRSFRAAENTVGQVEGSAA
ncbi:ATP-binding cassette domain-containing protein [Kribbella sp. VKM Ac-2568]|uniref:ATP-binding cassette domain-containing protein n=1 Tax=Kribbella sp. VKM Ac-2568 TaxID=2512219 RepID=UPI00104E244F|nr:ATP-binding cassette domain-containing protein [Kribbella sp. VKM Ac-2568]TCM45580.1 ABC-2 type transport system ATP-binding protein [Kribbella sp. VKM Ac-2568]